MATLEKEDGLTGDIFNMEPRGNVFSGGQSYGIAEHANDSIGPVVLSQQDNAEITRKIQASPIAVGQNQQPGQQTGQQGVQPGTGTGSGSFTPAPINMQDAEARKRGEWEPGYIKVPPLPPGESYDANVQKAKDMTNPLTYKAHVETGGDWDYKALTRHLKPNPNEETGNFNFGVTAKAFGFPEWLAKRGAGAYQIYRGTSSPEWGGPDKEELAKETNPVLHFFKKYKGVLTYPYGDDPVDQYDIQQGFKYYDQTYGGGPSPTD